MNTYSAICASARPSAGLTIFRYGGTASPRPSASWPASPRTARSPQSASLPPPARAETAAGIRLWSEKKERGKSGEGREAFLRRVFLLPPLSFPRLLRNGKARLKVPSFSSQQPPPTRVVACFGRFAPLIDQRRNAKGHPTGCPFLFKKSRSRNPKTHNEGFDKIKSLWEGRDGVRAREGKAWGYPLSSERLSLPRFPNTT